MKVLCYCEANSNTGFGHFSRVAILIKIIKKKYPNAKFEIFSSNKKEAKNFFKTKIVFSQNIFNFIEGKKKKYNLIILDPPYYEGKINSKLNNQLKKIFFIKNRVFKILKLTDETKPTSHYCDYLINDYPLSVKFKRKYKSINKNIILFLGIYAFLYPNLDFKKFTIHKKKYELLIAFGGQDPKNLAKKYFKSLIRLKIKKIFILNDVSYKAFSGYENDYNIIKPLSNQKKFLNFLSESKAYISTPSNIMFEAFSMNIPGIVIATQNRQKKMGKIFEKMHIVKSLGLFQDINRDLLVKNINNFFDIKLKFDISKAIKMQNNLIKNIK